jgi:hypothetical protein
LQYDKFWIERDIGRSLMMSVILSFLIGYYTERYRKMSEHGWHTNHNIIADLSGQLHLLQKYTNKICPKCIVLSTYPPRYILLR